MAGDSQLKPIPWYWNIVCASIAGSTAEVISPLNKIILDSNNSFRHCQSTFTNSRPEES